MSNRKREFYIASISDEQERKKQEKKPLEPVKEEKKDEATFVSPYFGRQLNKVVTPPAVFRGNKGFQYEAYRKEKKISPEEMRQQYGSEYYGYGVLNSEQYREILITGSLSNQPKSSQEEMPVEEEIVPVNQKTSTNVEGYKYYNDEENNFSSMPEQEIIIDEKINSIPVRHQALPLPPIKPHKKAKYTYPPISLLKKDKTTKKVNNQATEKAVKLINQVFEDFNFGGEVVSYIQGPSVTQFHIGIKVGTNVKNITGLEKDLMRYLEVRNIRIQDPIPGTSYAGIEIPNVERSNVLLGNLIDNPKFLNDERKLLVALGIDISGEEVYGDIAKMPHGLIAGATNSGKSVCINAMIISLLYRNTPEDLRLILIDPKMVELSTFDDIPHLAMPVITDAKQASMALKWATEEMDKRFILFKSYHVRNIDGFNELMHESKGAPMPKIVIIIDELADLMMAAGNEVESYIQRLTQKARAAGIHLIVATQRPSTDIIRGSIKNNILVRAAFKVASNVDSRTILDRGGAETLLGYGDMLFSDAYGERRLQGAYISDSEIVKVSNYLRENYSANYLVNLTDLEEQVEYTNSDDASNDPLFEEVARFVVRMETGSNNRITQAFKISFNRADRMLLAMETLGIVSTTVKGKQREVLVNEIELEDILKTRK